MPKTVESMSIDGPGSWPYKVMETMMEKILRKLSFYTHFCNLSCRIGVSFFAFSLILFYLSGEITASEIDTFVSKDSS